MRYKIRHFGLKEFRCRCCGRSDAAVALVFWLETFRRAVGRPLVINSGFRCPVRNVAVGGSVNSRHLIACAADVALPPGMNYDDFVDTARRMIFDRWEIVTYLSRTYVHIGAPREAQSDLWDGGHFVNLNISGGDF
jgi:hypothetical protein